MVTLIALPPLATVTCAWQVAALSFLVPRSTFLGSANFPFVYSLAMSRWYASQVWPALLSAGSLATMPTKMSRPLASWAAPFCSLRTCHPAAGVSFTPLPRSIAPPPGAWVGLSVGAVVDGPPDGLVVGSVVGSVVGCVVGSAVGVVGADGVIVLTGSSPPPESAIRMPPTATSSTTPATTMPMIRPVLLRGDG